MGSKIFKVILALLGLGFITGGIALVFAWSELERIGEENFRLRAASAQVDTLNAENQKLKRLQADADELERLRKQTQEIHKLRAQYQEFQELQKQYAALQLEHERFKAANQQLVNQQQALRSQFNSVVVAGASRSNTPTTPTPAAWLGVSIQTLAESPEVQSQNPGVTEGVVVAAVIPGTPAESSGLQVGDILTSIDGQAVATAAQLRDAMAGKQVGQRVVVDVFRGGLVYKVGVNAAPYPTQP